jgi:hypothetical protein
MVNMPAGRPAKVTEPCLHDTGTRTCVPHPTPAMECGRLPVDGLRSSSCVTLIVMSCLFVWIADRSPEQTRQDLIASVHTHVSAVQMFPSPTEN